MFKEKAIYILIRTLTYPLGLLPLKAIHIIGRFFGIIGYYFLDTYRKKALSNLSLAKDLKLSRKQILQISKESFQNLAINCLEYPKFAILNNFSSIFRCKNPQIAEEILRSKKGVIFLCGHQANWEVLFLDGTSRMPGIAIGKPIKNKKLYQWIVSIREKNGGKIIEPKNAVFEGFKALKRGQFIGIVGDQGMPCSGYSYPFLGRRAWTSTAPALLSYKTGCPIIFASTKRHFGFYEIEYSEPIWPDLSSPMEIQVPAIMDKALALMEESIKKAPGQWLWQHNRWKQQSLGNLYRRFRQDCLLIIMPEDNQEFEKIFQDLPTLRNIYKNDWITCLIPEKQKHQKLPNFDELLFYKKQSEILLDDLRFKIVFNFSENEASKKHFLRLSALEVLNLNDLKSLAKEHLLAHHENDLSEIFKRSLCRRGSTWN